MKKIKSIKTRLFIVLVITETNTSQIEVPINL